jgi:hypothetical protein
VVFFVFLNCGLSFFFFLVNFARWAFYFTLSQTVLETFRGSQDIANPIAAGAITGWLLSRTLPGKIRNAMMGGAILSLIEGLSYYMIMRARMDLAAELDMRDEGEIDIPSIPLTLIRRFQHQPSSSSSQK